VRRALAVLVLVLTWWLFYWDGEHWIRFGSWDSRSICEANAENFRAQGIEAVCIEIKAW
jgi:hypothetical protein